MNENKRETPKTLRSEENIMHRILKQAASLALSSMDKQSAVQLAARVAGAVARQDGHRGVQIVARVVAEGLAAYAEPSTAAVKNVPSERDPKAAASGSNNEGWQRALKLLENRSQGTGPTPGVGPLDAAPAKSVAFTSEGRVVSRGVLTGGYDTANIGAFAFSLYKGSQLQVNQLRVSGNVGGQFWLSEVPAGVWHRLKDRGSRLLPVWICLNGPDLEVQVDGGPDGAPVLQAVDMLSKSPFVG